MGRKFNQLPNLIYLHRLHLRVCGFKTFVTFRICHRVLIANGFLKIHHETFFNEKSIFLKFLTNSIRYVNALCLISLMNNYFFILNNFLLITNANLSYIRLWFLIFFKFHMLPTYFIH